MPDIYVTKCVDQSGNNLEGAVVIALSQEDFFQNVTHTSEGQDWPTMSFAVANKTDSNGQCVLSVSGARYAAVAFVYGDESVLSDIKAHIDLQA
jgi:hypothetical protein